VDVVDHSLHTADPADTEHGRYRDTTTTTHREHAGVSGHLHGEHLHHRPAISSRRLRYLLEAKPSIGRIESPCLHAPIMDAPDRGIQIRFMLVPVLLGKWMT